MYFTIMRLIPREITMALLAFIHLTRHGVFYELDKS